ncbi:ABC transporter ATP-binding protein [Kribbella sp. VKM Ac-2571]|uniref:ABC transporter ATP-binding protein n=1 Tax=Kribbella sp. VKM Ac-2571 TaxID=2512222 RepID=UPI0014150586|nr:ABC transporter ATP-binding protein [Kribbella sp. VKM Ac-2571]
MSGLWRFAGVARAAGRGLVVLTVGMVVLAAGAPVGTAVALGQVVAGVARGDRAHAVGWAVVVGACLLLQWLGGALRRAAATALGERVDARLQHELMRAVAAPSGVRHLEDPATAALVEVGRDTLRADWARPGRLASTIGGLATGRIILLASGVILAGFRWWLGVGLLVAGVWAAYEDRVASRTEAGHHYGATESARRMRYFNDLGTTPPAAKEIRLFGLPEFVVGRHGETWAATMQRILTPAGRRPLIATAFLGVVVLGGILLVVREAMTGRLAAGPTATYVQTFLIALGGIQQSSWSGLQTELALATLGRYDEAVRAIAPRAALADGSQPATGMPGREIAFRNVSFGYPGTSRRVLRDLDLVIPAGQSLAVVGANGAGKTSLVKLLCGLYEPNEGSVLIDGVELQDLDTEDWRRRLAVVFQQPVRLPMSAYANVRFGRGDADIEVAVERAGAKSIVEALPNGAETVLSAEFDGGVELSGGEWQRLGLARALYAVQQGASVLVLDEPAAHLDARSEAELYRRFLDLTAGLTTILISHRFSTVRQASSIVVLDEGRVIEQGSHDELIQRDGTYAHLFRLQAARFEGGPE